MKLAILVALLFVSFWSVEPVGAFNRTAILTVTPNKEFLRSELFFGMNKLSGGQVSETEWTKFLDDIVTPAFPDGYTVVDADGRFRDGSVTISEKSKVLIVIYPKSTKNESRRKLDAIRAAYVKQFDQKSVMRMDLPGSVNVF